MIGIIGAMEIEVEALKKDMKVRRTVSKAGMEFCQGVLSGCEAVVVRSGIGKVNAAVCTQILVDRYGVDAVVNTGIAGSLRNEINIGDIVLATDAVQHDMDATCFDYPVGKIPQMDVYEFQADEKLRELAKACSREVIPDVGVFEGRVVSGDQFVSSREKKDWLVKTFGGYCTEMEGAAIAQAAYLNNIPFLVIRSISDKADDSAHMDYPAFEAKAAENSVKLMIAMAERL